MLKTHGLELCFYKKDILGNEINEINYISDINENEKTHALLTKSTTVGSETFKFIFGDMYYVKDKDELFVFAFLFNNDFIVSYGFYKYTKEMLKEQLNLSEGHFTKISFLLEKRNIKNDNLIYIGNLFMESNHRLTKKLLSILDRNDAPYFDYDLQKKILSNIDFYEKENVVYQFYFNDLDVIKEFNIYENCYKATIDLFMTYYKCRNFSLPLSTMYVEKTLMTIQYADCQSGTILKSKRKEDDLISVLSDEGNSTFIKISSINNEEKKVVNNFDGLISEKYSIIILEEYKDYCNVLLENL